MSTSNLAASECPYWAASGIADQGHPHRMSWPSPGGLIFSGASKLSVLIGACSRATSRWIVVRRPTLYFGTPSNALLLMEVLQRRQRSSPGRPEPRTESELSLLFSGQTAPQGRGKGTERGHEQARRQFRPDEAAVPAVHQLLRDRPTRIPSTASRCVRSAARTRPGASVGTNCDPVDAKNAARPRDRRGGRGPKQSWRRHRRTTPARDHLRQRRERLGPAPD